MYNGVGLSSVRGTATSGHVQANRSHVNATRRRQLEEQHRRGTNGGGWVDRKRLGNQQRGVNDEIQEHQRKRLLENRLLELRERLESEKRLTDEEIEERIQKEREIAMESEKKLLVGLDTVGPDIDNLKVAPTVEEEQLEEGEEPDEQALLALAARKQIIDERSKHIAGESNSSSWRRDQSIDRPNPATDRERKDRKVDALARAFGIAPERHVEGMAFDKELQQQRKEERQRECEQLELLEAKKVRKQERALQRAQKRENKNRRQQERKEKREKTKRRRRSPSSSSSSESSSSSSSSRSRSYSSSSSYTSDSRSYSSSFSSDSSRGGRRGRYRGRSRAGRKAARIRKRSDRRSRSTSPTPPPRNQRRPGASPVIDGNSKPSGPDSDESRPRNNQSRRAESTLPDKRRAEEKRDRNSSRKRSPSTDGDRSSGSGSKSESRSPPSDRSEERGRAKNRSRVKAPGEMSSRSSQNRSESPPPRKKLDSPSKPTNDAKTTEYSRPNLPPNSSNDRSRSRNRSESPAELPVRIRRRPRSPQTSKVRREGDERSDSLSPSEKHGRNKRSRSISGSSTSGSSSAGSQSDDDRARYHSSKPRQRGSSGSYDRKKTPVRASRGEREAENISSRRQSSKRRALPSGSESSDSGRGGDDSTSGSESN